MCGWGKTVGASDPSGHSAIEESVPTAPRPISDSIGGLGRRRALRTALGRCLGLGEGHADPTAQPFLGFWGAIQVARMQQHMGEAAGLPNLIGSPRHWARSSKGRCKRRGFCLRSHVVESGVGWWRTALMKSLFPWQDPEVHPTVWLAPTAIVAGEVTMGAQSTAWFHAVIRGDVALITIGRKVNIQDGAVIHGTYGESETILEDNVSVGHNAIVHGAHVKEGALVGMGSVVMDHVCGGCPCRGGRRLGGVGPHPNRGRRTLGRRSRHLQRGRQASHARGPVFHGRALRDLRGGFRNPPSDSHAASILAGNEVLQFNGASHDV